MEDLKPCKSCDGSGFKYTEKDKDKYECWECNGTGTKTETRQEKMDRLGITEEDIYESRLEWPRD